MMAVPISGSAAALPSAVDSDATAADVSVSRC